MRCNLSSRFYATPQFRPTSRFKENSEDPKSHSSHMILTPVATTCESQRIEMDLPIKFYSTAMILESEQVLRIEGHRDYSTGMYSDRSGNASKQGKL